MVTDSYFAHCLAMLVLFIVAWSLSIGWAKADGIKPITDKFELGYVEDYPVEQNFLQATLVDEYDELKDLKRKVEIAKLKQQLSELNNPKPVIAKASQNNTNSQLQNDCTDALIGLGVPKRKASAEVKIILGRNPNIKTVQQFITEYGKR